MYLLGNRERVIAKIYDTLEHYSTEYPMHAVIKHQPPRIVDGNLILPVEIVPEFSFQAVAQSTS